MIVSNQKELSFTKALTDNDRSSKQLNKTPGSGGKERLFSWSTVLRNVIQN